jgi:hypothetical protein
VTKVPRSKEFFEAPTQTRTIPDELKDTRKLPRVKGGSGTFPSVTDEAQRHELREKRETIPAPPDDDSEV